ncbi:MAG TPA: hypothetical protein VNY35_06710 [Solirubrobacteraceae bacterium]|jgi:hypothetical protein|nr:hypothetical protein [Solirubrobacteraceae bacterium]
MTDLAMPELRSALVDAARRQHETMAGQMAEPGDAHARARRRWPGLRALRWRVVLVMLLLVLVGAAVAFASGLISFGAPAASVPVFANPRAGLGRIAPGTVRLLPLSVPDPHGGLPWGMRVLSTTRGVGCLQVGRLLDGRLVALGQDGAFGNDGRAHELPLSTNIERLNCSFVDGHGRIFDSVTIKSQVASAAPGVHCEPPGTYAPSHHAAFSTCPLADERNLYYGTLGPDATSLTYSASGTSHTVATLGADGAYLIVTPGTTHRYSGTAGSRERAGLYVSDEIPVYSPITAIHYRGEASCHLVTAERWIYGPRACAPPLAEPFGWIQAGVPTHAQLATPIHATLIRNAEGQRAIRVRFTSRVAISTLRGQYQLHWHEPGMAPDAYAAGPIDQGASAGYSGLIPQGRNIAAGQTLTKTLDQNRFGPRLAAGITTGSVILDYATGPLIQAEEDTAKIPVGTFKIRIP